MALASHDVHLLGSVVAGGAWAEISIGFARAVRQSHCVGRAGLGKVAWAKAGVRVSVHVVRAFRFRTEIVYRGRWRAASRVECLTAGAHGGSVLHGLRLFPDPILATRCSRHVEAMENIVGLSA